MGFASAKVSVSFDCFAPSIDLMTNPYYVVCRHPTAIVNVGFTFVEFAIYPLTKNVVIEDFDARQNIR